MNDLILQLFTLGQVNSVKSKLEDRLCGCHMLRSFSRISSFSRRPLVRLICLSRSSQLDACG